MNTILDRLKEKFLALAESRRFQAAVASVLIVLFKDQLNESLGLSVTEEQMAFVVATVCAWIVGDSINKTERAK